MSTALWIDASCGAAGDMILGALLDAGGSRPDVEASLAALSAASAERISLDVRPVRRHGLRASLAVITPGPSRVRRVLADVLALIRDAGLAAEAGQFAAEVFGLLARAESDVHGIAVEDVHFHEVGALDSIADVVGCAAALHSLGLLQPGTVRVVSDIALGSGTVSTEHGVLPVPVPAAVHLLAAARAPVSAGPGAGASTGAGAGDGELCTPTGAALLAALATEWGGLPPMSLHASGCGAGTRDPAGHANVVRVMVGESRPTAQPWPERSLLMVESTVDDLDPRLWPEALDALHAAGALDAWLTPVLMRKGRPGHVISALADAAKADAVLHALATSTTTLGARVHEVSRRSLPRDMVRVEVAGQPVAVKRGFLDGVPVVLQPEYADARLAAQRSGLPTAEVIDRAREQARGHGTRPAGTGPPAGTEPPAGTGPPADASQPGDADRS